MIFWKRKILKYAKRIVGPHICDVLNQIFRLFPFWTKKFCKSSKTSWKIVWKTIGWFIPYIYNYTLLALKSFAFFKIKLLWLYFTSIKIIPSFLKISCYNLSMVHVSQKSVECHTIFKKLTLTLYFYYQPSPASHGCLLWLKKILLSLV